MTKTQEQIADYFRTGGKNLIGAVIMWSLASVHAPRQSLRAALEDIGLGKAMPKDPRPQRLLSKAVESARLGAKGFLFRKLSGGRWAIVQESESTTGELEHTHLITLYTTEVEDPAGSYFEPRYTHVAVEAFKSKEAEALAHKVQEAYSDARDFANTDDLSGILTSAMGGTDRSPMLGAVSLRQGTGGVYFVPGPKVETVLRLKSLVERLGGSSHVTVLTMHSDAANLEEAAHAARASFAAKLNELQTELATFVAEMKEQKKAMTDRHVETRVRRLDTLRARVDMWNDVLGDVRGELNEQIETAKQEVAEAMGL